MPAVHVGLLTFGFPVTESGSVLRAPGDVSMCVHLAGPLWFMIQSHLGALLVRLPPESVDGKVLRTCTERGTLCIATRETCE